MLSGGNVRRFIVLIVVPVWGCFPNVAITDTDLLLSCDPGLDSAVVCPPDFVCKEIAGEGQCIANDVLSKAPIAVSSEVAVNAARFSIQDDKNAFSATFALSETPVALEVKAGGRNLVCETSGSGPVTYVCDTTIDATFDDGPNVVVVNARDAAGNVASSEARFVVDQNAPELNVVSAISTADPVVLALGASLTLNLVFDEVPVALSAALSPGGEACVVEALGGAVVTCAVTITDNTEGPRHLVITATDDVDNSQEIESDEILIVDVTPPAAPRVDVLGQVTYVRSPWGSGASDRAVFALQASVDAVEPGASVAVYADAVGNLVLAQAPPGDDIDLGAVDRASVFVAAVDAAGNRSEVVQVREQEWTASLGNKVGTRRFENPHQVFRVKRSDGRLIGNDEEAEDAAALDPGNDEDVIATVQPEWRIDEPSTLPADRKNMCLAFDSARGQVVLFGGGDLITAVLNDTWLFQDGRWRRQTPTTSPSPRFDVACAYDPVRDRVVMAGGTTAGNARLDEIWEWDGVTWARAGARLPAPVSAATAAFDVDSLSVVVVGGAGANGDVATVNSVSATGVVAFDGASPPARSRAAATVHPGGGIVFFGGESSAVPLDDTWLFEGGEFRALEVTAPAGVAADLAQAVLATVDGDVYFFAGQADKTFRLGANAWIEVEVERRPGARIDHRATSTPSEAILFGGAFDDLVSTQRFSANTAEGGVDYNNTPVAVNIPAGTTEVNLNVATTADDAFEDDENFTDTLTSIAGATAGSVGPIEVTIVDDDAEPTLSVADVSVDESASTVTVVVTLLPASGKITRFSARTIDGTATSPSDYDAINLNSVNIAKGSTSANIVIDLNDDLADEDDETFTVIIGDNTLEGAVVGDGTAVVTIRDNDLPPIISVIIDDDDAPTFVLSDVFIDENGGTANITLLLSERGGLEVSVDFTTVDVTAVAGSDYSARSGRATIAAGQQNTTIAVPIINDTLDEIDETFLLRLSNATNARIVDSEATITIRDNDQPPTISIAGTSVVEGNDVTTPATFVVSLSTASGRTVVARARTVLLPGQPSAADIEALDTLITFNPGETSLNVVVGVVSFPSA